MKILIVSYYFPPFNAVGAVRVGKLAKYLAQAGHEIKILSANNQPLPTNLPVEVDEKQIVRTPWFDINKPIQLLLGGQKSVAIKGFERAGRVPTFIKKLGYYYKDIVNFPDGQIGWYPFAIKAGKNILKDWKPNVILSSSSPPTAFLIAKKLSSLFKIPWVADLRDLWSDNHNADIYESSIRRYINQKIEKRVLSTASALITVSEPLANILKTKFNKPISIIKNGYDLADYPLPELNDPSLISLRIVYTGIIHPVKRDPEPLFKAITLLGQDAAKIQIDFYGRNNAIIKKSAMEYGIDSLVNCYDSVPYNESLKHQVNADILLLLTYNADKERGVITTKFFEYLGARRPILLLGCTEGVAADMIRERQAGFVSNDPEAIAAFLKNYMLEKESGITHKLSSEAILGFSRQEQALELAHVLEQLRPAVI